MEIITQLVVTHTVTRQACGQRCSFSDPLFFLTVKGPLATCQPDDRGPITNAKQLVIPEWTLRLDGA